MRKKAIVIALAIAVSLLSGDIGNAIHAHNARPVTDGCSLYTSIPNPCDPDSNN